MHLLIPAAMSDLITFYIDDRPIAAQAGRNLVDVAREQGLFIPTLRYHPQHGQPLGTCRVCNCLLDGRLGVACTTRVYEGLHVAFDTPALTDLRRAMLEMMFAEGNHFCPSCEKSGQCDLHHMGYELGIAHARFPHLFQDRLIDYGPRRMVLEHNRCIKCRRCVEEIRTDEGRQVFSYLRRGNDTRVGIDYAEEARLSEAQAEAAVRCCPTGAIMLRGKSQSRPFGDRPYDRAGQKVEIHTPAAPLAHRTRKRIATTSLAGCFGCHMSMLDIDTGLLDLLEWVEIDCSPLTDLKTIGERCHLGVILRGTSASWHQMAH
ncbi:MAG: hypothetical protein OHK0039_19360 [Bacteroidia bacterium]